MSSGPTLPPQAYTREILTSAFNWLQSQPESVKKLATTPDALVGLYMRAQRFGASSLEADAPVSSQNFMSDLKNLAEDLKQFEVPKNRRTAAAQAAPQAPVSMPQAQVPSQPVAPVPPNAASIAAEMAQAHHAQSSSMSMQAARFNSYQSGNQASPPMHGHQPTPPVPPTPPYQNAHPAHNGHVGNGYNYGYNHELVPVRPDLPVAYDPSMHVSALNNSSQAMLREVKSVLNLSSDEETLNLMVALAYKKLKNLLV